MRFRNATFLYCKFGNVAFLNFGVSRRIPGSSRL
jgi:hypothetical protein